MPRDAFQNLFQKWMAYFAHRRVRLKREDGTRSRTVALIPRDKPEGVCRSLLTEWLGFHEKSGLREKSASLKRRRVFLDQTFESHGTLFIPKIYVYRDVPRILEGLFFFSDARRNFTTLCFLERNGVRVTPAWALVNEFKGPLLHRSTILLEKLGPSIQDYKDMLYWIDTQEENVRERFFQDLGRALARLHTLGIFTKDTDKNTMVEKGDNEFRFYFLDFDSVFPWRVPNYRRTKITMGKYLVPDHKYSAGDLETFFTSYLHARGKQDWLPSLLNHYLDVIKHSPRHTWV